MAFQLREGYSRVAIPIEVVADVIERLKRENGGMVTAKQVVDYARPADSPIHDHFEWDDAEAAERYREDQARNLIRCYYVIPDLGPDQPEDRRIANVRVVEDDRRGYISTDRAIAKEDLKAQVFRDTIRLLNGLRARLANFKDAERAIALIEQAEVELTKGAEHKARAAGKSRKATPKPVAARV